MSICVGPAVCLSVVTCVHSSICPSVLLSTHIVCLSFQLSKLYSRFKLTTPHRNPHPLFIPAVANKYLSKFDTPMSCSQGKIRFAEIFYVHFNPPLLSLWLVILLLLSLLLTSRYVIEMLIIFWSVKFTKQGLDSPKLIQ